MEQTTETFDYIINESGCDIKELIKMLQNYIKSLPLPLPLTHKQIKSLFLQNKEFDYNLLKNLLQNDFLELLAISPRRNILFFT